MRFRAWQFVLLACCIVCFRTEAAEQVVWFAPLDATPRPWSSHSGSQDFLKLFEAGAPWAKAASRIKVFKMYQSAVLQFSDGELAQIFGYLNSRQIALALELGALSPGLDCGSGVEGFGPPVGDVLRRIKDNGGTLRYVAMDEPYYFGSLYSGPGGCRWTAVEVAKNVAANVAAIRTVFPNVIVGDIEPVPAPGARDTSWLRSYSQWMDAYQAEIGVPLAFFHADMIWDQPAWRDYANAARSVVADRGIPFGIIYNGLETDDSDEEWLAHTEAAFVSYELYSGEPPQHVVFQSWSAYPRKLLPETDAGSFTYTLNRYFRIRTRLSLASNASLISGILSGDGPVPGAPIRLIVASARVPAQSGQYVLSGIVPNGAESALVGFRVNTECACEGSSDFTLREFKYSDAVDSVVTLDFRNGLQGWYLDSTAKAVLQQSARHEASSSALHVSANKKQNAMLNSLPFPVRPGATFILQISSDIHAKSAGSGYFTVIFLVRGVEIARQNLGFGESGAILPTVYTAADGFFVAALEQALRNSAVTAAFAGDESHWPAESTIIP